jgi:integrase
MSAQRGNVYETRNGYGIRWREGDQRRYQSGFRTKTEARTWFRDQIAPRLHRVAPSAEITFDEFCELFLSRHAGQASTVATLRDRLTSARAHFGDWTLAELEFAANDIAAWRSTLPEGSRYRLTNALRQVFEAAKRWRYIARNPAVEMGPNPQPRAEEIEPFSREQIEHLAAEMGPIYGPLVVFVAETGLRTNEWVALERRDVDRAGAITVQRRYAKGELTPYPKTVRSRRRIPLTARALEAVESLPARIDTPLLFPASRGGHIGLDTWRTRDWYSALDATGIARRGPYCLRHTFATEALAAGISTFELSRLMGTSLEMIERTYAHYSRDTEEHIRARLNARSAHMGVSWASDDSD